MATVNLERTTRMAWKIQAADGIAETLAEPEFAVSISGDKQSLIPNEYQRESKTGSLTRRADVKGARQVTFNSDVEMIGGSATTEPKWGELVRASGFSRTALIAATLTTVTGTFSLGDRVGNNVAENSATKRGIVVAYYDGTAKVLVIRPTAGTWANADAVNNYTVAGAGTVTGAPAAAGWGYIPQSETDVSETAKVTMGRIADGEFVVGTDGRCTGSIQYAFGKVPMYSMELQGSLKLADDGNALAVPSLGTIPSPGAVPLPCKGMPIRMFSKADGTAYTPILTQAEIKIGNSLTMRETVSDADYVNSGYLGSRITARDPMLTADPEHDKAGLLATLRTMVGGTFKAYTVHGLATHGNGQTIVYAPAAQFSGNLDTSDRNGISTKSVNLKLTGNADDEMGIYVVYV